MCVAPTTTMTLQKSFLTAKRVLGKPYEDLEFLLQGLKNVLEENGEAEIARAIPWINDKEPTVEEITPEGVIMNQHGQRFHLDRE